MTRPRFTLRTLLILVTVCAVGTPIYSLLPHRVTVNELRALKVGMTKEQVRLALGKPDIVEVPGTHVETWQYRRKAAEGLVIFSDGLLTTVYLRYPPRPRTDPRRGDK
jgi:outer membrane protein assembly factor BamE (lipoprotein component of BamABCDE complex)